MEIQTEESLKINLVLSEDEAQAILDDPRAFQSELRKALGRDDGSKHPLRAKP